MEITQKITCCCFLKEGGMLFSSFESAKKLIPLFDVFSEQTSMSPKKCCLLVDESHNIKTWVSRSQIAQTLFSISSSFGYVIFNSGSFFNETFENLTTQMRVFSGEKDLVLNNVKEFKDKFGV